MNPPKCDELDYIHFLIAAQKTFTCTEAARCQPESPDTPSHDAFPRLLQRQPLDTMALWQEAQAFVQKERGLLVLEDTTLDKPYTQKQAPTGGEGDCPFDLTLDGWESPHSLRLSGLRQTHLPQDQERAFSGNAGGSQGARLSAGVCPDGQLVFGVGEPQAHRFFWLAFPEQAQKQPDGEPRWPAWTSLKQEGWVCEGIPDGPQRRGCGILGDERPGDDGGKEGHAGSSCAEGMLWCGKQRLISSTFRSPCRLS